MAIADGRVKPPREWRAQLHDAAAHAAATRRLGFLAGRPGSAAG
jgi:hypothetical protein